MDFGPKARPAAVIHLVVLLHFFTITAGAATLIRAQVLYARNRTPVLRWFFLADLVFTLLMVLDALRIYASKNAAGQADFLMPIIGFLTYILGMATVFASLMFASAAMDKRLAFPFGIPFIIAIPLPFIVSDRTISAVYTALILYAVMFGVSFLREKKTKNRSVVAVTIALLATHGLTFAAMNLISGMPEWVNRIPYSQGIYLVAVGLGFLYLRKYRAEYDAAPIDTARRGAELGLSEREIDIVAEVILGKSNADIGAKLFISPNTVKNHIYNIYKKLNIKNRYELIARFSGKDTE